MLPTLLDPAIGYLVGTSIAVIGLYISMAIPIFLRLKEGDQFERGSWSLGKHYKWISPIAVIWILFVCVLFLLPVSPDGVPGAESFDWAVVNYAPITVGAVLLLVGAWYLLSARKWFRVRCGKQAPRPSWLRSSESSRGVSRRGATEERGVAQ